MSLCVILRVRSPCHTFCLCVEMILICAASFCAAQRPMNSVVSFLLVLLSLHVSASIVVKPVLLFLCICILCSYVQFVSLDNPTLGVRFVLFCLAVACFHFASVFSVSTVAFFFRPPPLSVLSPDRLILLFVDCCCYTAFLCCFFVLLREYVRSFPRGVLFTFLLDHAYFDFLPICYRLATATSRPGRIFVSYAPGSAREVWMMP